MLVQAGRPAPSLTTVYQTLVADLVPNFLAVARTRLGALDAKLTDFERSELNRGHPVYPDGRPLVPRPADTRLTSTDREVRAAARIALRQVLSVYAEAEADRSALLAMAGKIDALRINEFVRL
jgi:hypothetical protein